MTADTCPTCKDKDDQIAALVEALRDLKTMGAKHLDIHGDQPSFAKAVESEAARALSDAGEEPNR